MDVKFNAFLTLGTEWPVSRKSQYPLGGIVGGIQSHISKGKIPVCVSNKTLAMQTYMPATLLTELF
jgi:hypothetical protein